MKSPISAESRLEELEIQNTKLRAALVTIFEEVTEMCRLKDLEVYDHKRVYQNIKFICRDALKVKK